MIATHGTVDQNDAHTSELDVDAHEFIPVLTNKHSKVFRSLLLIKLKFPDTNILYFLRYEVSLFLKTVIPRTITITIYL